MAPQELMAFGARMGWSRAELSPRLEISASRLVDFELGHTPGKNPQPAPIPNLSSLPAPGLASRKGRTGR
jgi:hypothetical protein